MPPQSYETHYEITYQFWTQSDKHFSQNTQENTYNFIESRVPIDGQALNICRHSDVLTFGFIYVWHQHLTVKYYCDLATIYIEHTLTIQYWIAAINSMTLNAECYAVWSSPALVLSYPPLWYGGQNIHWKLGQYHGCWYPGFLHMLWYWLCKMNWPLSTMTKDFNCPFHLNTEKLHKMIIHFHVSSK